MNPQDAAYWMILSHLPKWKTERINKLIVAILHDHAMSFADFFALDPTAWYQQFGLDETACQSLAAAKIDLPNQAFVAETLLNQGFELIPLNSPLYSQTLKQNLKSVKTPPLLYVKGNTQLLNEQAVAVVGSRKASQTALTFTDHIAEKCSEEYKVIVSGFAKGVDRRALDAALDVNGHSIIVLPQGILTFGSGIKKYYKKIVNGDLLVLSAFYPKTPWSVGLAMARNAYIYGLADTIFVAESGDSGGTWSGVLDGLKKGRTIYIRQPESGEKNANQKLIQKGATPVDMFGNPLDIKPGESTSLISQSELEQHIKTHFPNRTFTAEDLGNQVTQPVDENDLTSILSNMPCVVTKKQNGQHVFRYRKAGQIDLFV